MIARIQSVIQWLASPRWAVVFFLATAVGASAVLNRWTESTAAMMVPLALLVTTLAASIITHRRFRNDVPLLLFHLALVALVLLLILARLTFLEGVVTVRKSASFDGQLQTYARGPLHDLAGLRRIRFENLGFIDDYRTEGRVTSRNNIRWHGSTGSQELEISLDKPLVVGHYRVYTSHHRGLAAVMVWEGNDGTKTHGAVEFAIQKDGFSHGSSWRLPNGQEAWAKLDIPTLPERKPGSQVKDLWAPDLPHSLVLRIGDDRFVFKVGETHRLPEGTLTYRDFDSWMGYRVLYDPARPWLLATILLAVASLIWFYARNVFFRPQRGEA